MRHSRSQQREYFPRAFAAAVRQRSRWVAGIALQGWQYHGWRVGPRHLYWLWRDRKSLVGNLLSPAANLVSLYLTGSWIAGRVQVYEQLPAPIRSLFLPIAILTVAQTVLRGHCCARVYGWRLAALTPIRVLWANQVNGVATAAALGQFLKARLSRRDLAWRKTDHVYPVHRAAPHGRPRLGEVLVRMRRLSRADLDEALRTAPPGLRLGEHLVQSRKVSEEDLYLALSAHAGIPLGRPPARERHSGATRTLPAATARRWKVLLYRVAMGQLHLLTSDVPTEAMSRELSGLSGLEIRFRLVRPSDLDELTRQYLGQSAVS